MYIKKLSHNLKGKDWIALDEVTLFNPFVFVTQLVEYGTFNARVTGSSPVGDTSNKY